MNAQTPATPDLTAIKAKQQAAWASGDYAVVGTTLQIVGETLCEARRPAQRPARARRRRRQRQCDARRRPPLRRRRVDRLCRRAARARPRARRRPSACRSTSSEADAEALPFADASFDVVLSTFGVMFTPNQEQAASELLRVCRRGGKIGLANWTPESFIGQLFKTIGKHVPPRARREVAGAVGHARRISTSCSARARRHRRTSRAFHLPLPSPTHWLDVFRTYYGPMLKAFAAIDAGRAAGARGRLCALIDKFNVAGTARWSCPANISKSSSPSAHDQYCVTNDRGAGMGSVCDVCKRIRQGRISGRDAQSARRFNLHRSCGVAYANRFRRPVRFLRTRH